MNWATRQEVSRIAGNALAWPLAFLCWAQGASAWAQVDAGSRAEASRWERSLGQRAGDPESGAAIVADRQRGLCLLCHSAPVGDTRFQGNLAPSLAGAGSRWTRPELRQRIADASQINPQTIMPSYSRIEDLYRVASPQVGKPLLSGQEIEDVVAYLETLKL